MPVVTKIKWAEGVGADASLSLQTRMTKRKQEPMILPVWNYSAESRDPLILVLNHKNFPRSHKSELKKMELCRWEEKVRAGESTPTTTVSAPRTVLHKNGAARSHKGFIPEKME